MYYFNFTVTEFFDSHPEGERTLIDSLNKGLTQAGFICNFLPQTNNSTQLCVVKNGTTYHIGQQIERKTSPSKVLIAVKHNRSPVDKLLGRNKLAPQNYIEKTLRDILKSLPDVSDLQESQSFEEIKVDNGTFA
ncbi:hypothetical protein DL239_05465 [Sedimentitalea sp. CY04]|uniref:Uncharacterized protein n=1 Tax=Parasedimentitalea denitrificans TaxID=2211118 RepID=A0ABX0W8D4_9RHOB|nr:hypothetical protein [Sedimentitalea sp. CY04]NIZ60421.1 hypothetical protein [Sedimentitalea sp. CY04]